MMHFCHSRMGFLRDLWNRWKADPDTVYSLPGDMKWEHASRERIHFYFFVEHLLKESGYAVGQLFSPVETYDRCHHKTIGVGMLGFVYFLLFEYMFKQKTYSGSPGRKLINSRREAVKYFMEVAEKECEDIACLEPGQTRKQKREELVEFYK